MDFEPSARSKDYLTRVRAFIEQYIAPLEVEYHRELLAQRIGI